MYNFIPSLIKSDSHEMVKNKLPKHMYNGKIAISNLIYMAGLIMCITAMCAVTW